jgi:fructose-1,6-bisphosphatase/inositol monophosphatase family enzyme
MSISLSNLLIDATRIPSRKLLRDYYELESLQNNGQQNSNFVLQSLKRIKDNIALELLKHKITSNFFFAKEEKPKGDFFIYIVPIDSIENLSRAKPFFGIMATLFKDNQPEMCVVNFPAIKEILYAEKDRGLWTEKLNRNDNDPVKIRSSNISDLNNAHIITDNLDSILEYQDYFQSFANIEIINSPLYNLYLVCHGIVDACIIRNDCDFFSQSLSFLAKESKALFKTISNNKKAIITNVKISMPKSIDKE